VIKPIHSKYSTHADDFYAQIKPSGPGREETNVQPYVTFTSQGTWIVAWTQTSQEIEPGQRPDQRAGLAGQGSPTNASFRGRAATSSSTITASSISTCMRSIRPSSKTGACRIEERR